MDTLIPHFLFRIHLRSIYLFLLSQDTGAVAAEDTTIVAAVEEDTEVEDTVVDMIAEAEEEDTAEDTKTVDVEAEEDMVEDTMVVS